MNGTEQIVPVEIAVVQAPGCHFCDDAQEAIEALAAQYPLRLRLIDIYGTEGQRLVHVHRPWMNPLVLVDGEFFSAGRLPRGKLRRLLDRSAAGASAAVG
jgi:thiol-disulfide isomerase/thioredoxin